MQPNEWRYVGIDALEPRVEPVLRGQNNALVIAGPGAGKTELLAQRACYLLQTGQCLHPRRILAISFKRDATKNLRRRVASRCGADLARRFESYTFDAFAKQLLDRFVRGLPAEWRPTADYALVTDLEKTFREQFHSLQPPETLGTLGQVFAIPLRDFQQKHFCSTAVLRDEAEVDDLTHWVARALWQRFIVDSKPSQLSFPMIATLAAYLLETNRPILAALCATYSHVFLDEFQDTTWAQYRLIKTCFATESISLTAVGDNKQRIMLWAGAMPDVFDRFEKQFSAEIVRPVMNYRSSPELVAIQATLIRKMDAQAPIPVPFQKRASSESACEVLLFPHQEAEVDYLAQEIQSWLTTGGLKPRDICILVKQVPDVWGGPIVLALQKLGIDARVEVATQDILAEPFVECILVLLKIIAFRRAGVYWNEALQLLRFVWNLDPNSDESKSLDRSLTTWRRLMRERFDAGSLTVQALIRAIVTYIGERKVRAAFPQYAQGDYLDQLNGQFMDLARKSSEGGGGLVAILRRIEGQDSIPITTIHKSKGLEYDTVIFIGLEDDAFWSFKTQSQEDTCSFFVAFSRAKRRVLFTFSQHRVVKGRTGLQRSRQSRDSISTLYELLAEAGVPTRTVGEA